MKSYSSCFPAASLGIMLLLFSCNPSGNIHNEGQNSGIPAPRKTDSPAAPESTPAPESLTAAEAAQLVNSWNTAINQKNYEALRTFYAEDVNYNHEVLSAAGLAEKKKKEAAEAKISRQDISELKAEAPVANVEKIAFKKKIISGGKVRDFNTILLLENHDGSWKIVAENDKALDVVMEEETPRTMPESSINSCDKAAIAIFLSSAEVQQLLKDETVKYKIEYKPGSAGNPNDRYWFWVYLPHDGNTETYGRFQVDPLSGKLYEYDAVADQAKVIDADAGLSGYLKKYCGK